MLNNLFKINVMNGVTIVCTKGLWGLLDANNNNLIVEPKYLYISNPNKYGLCIFEDVDGGLGYINLQGKIVIPACFDFISSFSHGFCKVTTNNETGVCDVQGEMIVPASYDDVLIRKKFIMVVKDGLWGAYSLDGVKILDPLYVWQDEVYELVKKTLL